MDKDQVTALNDILQLAQSCCAPVTWEDPEEERRELHRAVEKYLAEYGWLRVEP